MSLLRIFNRGEDELTARFEDAMYDILDATEEVCALYEQMKSQFMQRAGNPGMQPEQMMPERSGQAMPQRMASRMNRRSRDTRGRWI